MTEYLACGIRELKFAESAGVMKFNGYGAVFGNIDAHGDVIEPGAFAAYLADAKAGRQPWPAMLSQHGGMGLIADDLTPIGAWLDLAEDGTGLRVEGELAATPRGREMYTLMKMEPRPAIDGLSIGYIPKDWEPRSKPEDPRRRLKRIDVLEISPVLFPANRLARVDAVKSIEALGSLADGERFLRDHGFSKAAALALVSRIKQFGRSDSGPPDDQSDSGLVDLEALLQRRRQALSS